MLPYALVTVLSLLGAVTSLPEYLKPLEAVWSNEEALTDALRAYDKERAKRMDQLLEEVYGKPGGSAAPSPETADEKLAEVKQLLSQVREGYEAALREYPSNARLCNYYGELLYDRYNDHAGAIRQWHTALSYDDKLAAAYNNLALHHFHVGEYDTGLRCMDAALKNDKKNPDYYYNMVNFYLAHFPQVAELRKWKKDKVYKEAMKMSERAAKYAPDDYDIQQDYAVNFYAAENFGLKAEWEDAAKAWQQARAVARTDDERFYCWLNEGRVWLRGGKPEQGIACLEEALRMKPDSVPARQLLDSVREAPEAAPVAPAESPATP